MVMDLNIHWIAGNQFIENKIQSSEIYNHKFHKLQISILKN